VTLLETHLAGDRKRDTVPNVARDARLGVPEDFVDDIEPRVIEGWRSKGETGV
jgi:hypothetical protein